MEPKEPPLVAEREVGRLVGGRLHPPELLCGEPLDSRRGSGARELRRQLRVLSAQVGAFTAKAVELHVQAQHGDIGRDHACKQSCDDPDPEDPAGDPVLALRDARSRSRSRSQRGGCLLGPGGGGPGCHDYVFTPTRSRADDDLGFAAVSAPLGRTALREVERSSGVFPHTQTGKSGGHSQPRSRSRMKRLTIRSSREWKLITASRPPGRSIEKADGRAVSRAPSSSLTAMRSAWNTRLAGCPSPKRAGAGIAALIVSTRSPVLSKGCSFLRRTIAFAIGRAYRSSP